MLSCLIIESASMFIASIRIIGFNGRIRNDKLEQYCQKNGNHLTNV